MTTAKAPAFPARAIVAAIGSPPGHELERAREIATTNGAALHVLPVDDHVDPGRRAFTVSDLAEDVPASLVVVGPERTGLAGRSIAERVHEIADRAVLQIVNPVHGPYEEVVIAAHESSALGPMTEAARYLAPNARRFEYVHAYLSPWEPMLIGQGFGLVTVQHHRRATEADARQRMTELLESADLDPSALRLEHGPAALVLSEIGARVLLVVNRGRSWLKHAAFGSVTRSVLETSMADVLVV